MQLPSDGVVMDFKKSKRRLLVLGYNSTLTTAVEAPRQPKNHYDQIKVKITWTRQPPSPPFSLYHDLTIAGVQCDLRSF